jgi:cellulose biosynthesis protein BcsQ
MLEAVGRARVRLVGIVPNRVEHRTRHEAEVLEEMGAQHGALVLTEIPSRVVLRDAAIAGQPVSLYAPQSDAAVAFDRLAKEALA